jgi:hypothetical protein
MVDLHVFRWTPGNAQIVTDDKSGKKLPPHPSGKWVFSKTIDVQAGQHLIGADVSLLLANIARHGYHRWPDPKEHS